MTEQNYQNPQVPSYEEESEIDIMELLSKLWKKRVLIIKWCIAGAILGLVVGFSIPKTYTASVTLVPESEGKGGGNLSSLAAMAGINLSDNSVDAINVSVFPEVVASTPFIVELFDMPVSFMHKDTLVETNLLDYLKEYQKSPWWTPILKAPFKALGWCMSLLQGKEEEEDLNLAASELDAYNLPKKERDIVKSMTENIVVTFDKKTGKTSISAEMQDPQIVADVVSAVVDNLKAYMSHYRTSKARQDVENLTGICNQRKDDYYKAQQAYADFVDANKNVVLQSAQAERERLQQEMNLAYQVYSQVATQLEAARIAEQKAKPVFTVIKPVEVPNKRTAPSKAKILIIFTFLAGCIIAVWVLWGDEYWDKMKEQLSEKN